jgi:hypothetical protein
MAGGSDEWGKGHQCQEGDAIHINQSGPGVFVGIQCHEDYGGRAC